MSPESARKHSKSAPIHGGRASPADVGTSLLRKLILAVVAFGVVGLSAELVLLEHWESSLQWIPFGLMGVALPLLAAVILGPSRGLVRALRALMALFVAAGGLGLWLHWQANAQLEMEMNPSIEGWLLIRRTLFGGVPFLAPGALVQMGLVGLVALVRHPASRR